MGAVDGCTVGWLLGFIDGFELGITEGTSDG